MIKAKLLAKTDVEPVALASHAALKCYQAESPKLGKTIKVKERLFDVGHHTTMQHTFFTFDVEGIAVGDITAGLHLVSPFYNSDQRSGRYCATMFSNPNYDEIEEYISTFWPDVKSDVLDRVMNYIIFGVRTYNLNIDRATEVARRFLKEERPFISEKSLDATAPKIAQEQLRMFIPAIFPTGLDFTVNTTVLSALYLSAWTPAMKKLTAQMVQSVLDEFPQLSFAFDSERRKGREYSFDSNIPLIDRGIKDRPGLIVESIGEPSRFVMPSLEDMHPVDLLHFMPEYMNNSTQDIKTVVEVSFATMGQDQRHRTIRRSQPAFTGNFYLPAIPLECGLSLEAEKLRRLWISLGQVVPLTLMTVAAPYGAMVSYAKKGSYNAVAHEQIKRLCWCAQEEISEVGRMMRLQIDSDWNSPQPLMKIFQPPCYDTGKCVEGDRYCGRDLRVRTPETYFPKRRV